MNYQSWIRKQYEEGHGLSWQPNGADVWEAATKAERERCARVCESFGGNELGDIDDDWSAMCAAAIRAS